MKPNRKEAIKVALIGVVLLGVCVAAGSILHLLSPRYVLDNSEEFILYSLDPYLPNKGPVKGKLYKFAILGKTKITDPIARAKLVDALYTGMELPANRAFCFEPHHAIRATRRGRTVDVVVCFGCQVVDFYVNGKKRSRHTISYKTSKVFEQTVQEAHLPARLLRD